MTPQARSASASSSRRSRLVRAGARIAAGLGLATLAIGALHLPFARPLLMRVGGCPLAGAKMTPAEMDVARHIAVTGGRGAGEAPARPALVFTLDATTLVDVHSWAARAHVACDDVRPGLVKCAHVPPGAVGRANVEGPIDELTLAFGARGRLENVTTFRTDLRPGAAARAAEDVVSSLTADLGPPAKSAGDFALDRLAQSGAASLATRAYRYRDYVAEVTAIHLPSSGLSLREHYMSAND
jgi:hypothetical protein